MGEDKAFRIPVTMKTFEGTVELSRAITQADQGSDLNVIGKSLAVRLGLPLGNLAEIGFKGMAMRVANGSITPLREYAIAKVGVAGIWRTINCFVLPQETENILPGSDVCMLLGLPWLYSVNAVIGIMNGSIRIGDTAANEKPRVVQGPELVFSPEHSILLYPKSAVSQATRKVIEKEEQEAQNQSSSEDEEPSSVTDEEPSSSDESDSDQDF